MNKISAKEITNQKQWDKFVTSQKFFTFLQSWAWGEFLKLEEGPIYRIGFFDGEKLLGVALLVLIAARRGTFLFCPHGPIIDWKDQKVVNAFFNIAKRIAMENRCWFVRISSLVDTETQINAKNLFKNAGYLNAPIHMHAEDSWILDISKNEEELLSDMRKTARYLVRQAEKLGVKTEIKTDKKDIEKFADIHIKHAKNNTYIPFKRTYLLNEWEIFSKENNIAVFFSYYKKELLAAAVIVFYSSWAFYYQAVTEKNKIPAGYSLVWEAIKEAKKRGCTGFNFWGVAPENKPNHPWSGLSLFKQGFGGRRIKLLHAQDLALSSMYWLTYGFETMRKIMRGF